LSEEQNEQHAAYPNAWRDVVCYLDLVKPKDVENRTSWDYKKIDESCSMHSVTFVSHINNTLLNVRDLVKPKDVENRTSWDCKKIDESCSMHSVTFVSHINNTLLNVRDLAYFCP